MSIFALRIENTDNSMAYFKRNIDKRLLEWKESRNRKPLLVRGARQIGKSSSIRNFARSFRYFIEINFEMHRNVASLFEQEYDVDVLCERLSVLYSTPVIPGETLLFFDEVQACESALKSLWFFKENLPELHVIAAGSLLEFSLKNMPAYGVGRVSSIFMYPLSFNEFLSAIGKDEWVEAIEKASARKPLFEALHKELVGAYRTFLLVGGMPASVKAWVETRNYQECIDELSDIQQTYYDDFTKYSKKISPEVLKNTLQSVIAQTGQKFMYSKVSGAYPAEEVKRSLDMLVSAGIVKPVRYTAANGMPLGAEVNHKFTKYLYLDSGLLLRVLDLDFGGSKPLTEMIVAGSEADLVNKGKLAELSVGWELVKASNSRHGYELYYWENLDKGTTSEVDYIVAREMQVLPVEVKSGTSGKMKSLRLFMNRKHIGKAIRTSLENFGVLTYDDGDFSRIISIVPIYAIGLIVDK